MVAAHRPPTDAAACEKAPRGLVAAGQQASNGQNRRAMALLLR